MNCRHSSRSPLWHPGRLGRRDVRSAEGSQQHDAIPAGACSFKKEQGTRQVPCWPLAWWSCRGCNDRAIPRARGACLWRSLAEELCKRAGQELPAHLRSHLSAGPWRHHNPGTGSKPPYLQRLLNNSQSRWATKKPPSEGLQKDLEYVQKATR